MKVSVIIPTKDRAPILGDTLETLFSQTSIPDEIVIVDQSSGDETKKVADNFATRVRASRLGKPEFLYLYDPNLIGAGAARNIAIERSSGDVLVFLDDDVLLENNFLHEMLAVYQQNPEVGGVSGVITNYPRPPFSQRLLETLFLLGPFHDERQPIYWSADRLRDARPIRVRRFGSGLMSVKRSALNGDRFDGLYRGAGPEDVDLTWRLSQRCRLVITPRARLVHVRTEAGGPREDWLTCALKSHYYLYYRLWNRGTRNRLCFAWLNFGYSLLTTASSLRRLSLAPWRGFRAGVRASRELASRGNSRRLLEKQILSNCLQVPPGRYLSKVTGMKVSLIIPTRSRAAVLADMLETSLSQTCPPDEIVIVDESSGDETKKVADNFAARVRDSRLGMPKFVYLHAPNLIGAGAARNIGIERSSGDVLVFLDDDVLLEKEFLQEMLAVYQQDPEVGGASGVITNYPRPPFSQRFLEALFLLGPFHDERQPIYWNADRLRNAKPIPVRKFGSGLMSLKRSALNGLRFDSHSRNMGEDVVLTWRVSERCPLVITPRARLVHLRTKAGGPRADWLKYAIESHYYHFYRLWNVGFRNRFCFAWLNIGYEFLTVLRSIRHHSLHPWRALSQGIRLGRRVGRSAPERRVG